MILKTIVAYRRMSAVISCTSEEWVAPALVVGWSCAARRKVAPPR